MKRFALCLSLAAAVLPLFAAADDEPPIIAKARAFLGSESDLANVHALHMTGTMTAVFNGDPASKRSAKLDIVFQKPWEESLLRIAPDAIDRRVLDGYDGWLLQQRRGPGDPAQFDPRRPETFTILGVDQVRMLRADTWENLYFYRGIDRVGGTMRDLGPATIDGVKCEEVEFAHTDRVVYDRYFDLDTGRLVFTRSKSGAQIREKGYQVVAGIKFPRVITIEEPTGGKGTLTTVTVLDHIAVNEDLPESYFETPPPPLPVEYQPAPAAPAPAAKAAAPAPAVPSSAASAAPPAASPPQP